MKSNMPSAAPRPYQQRARAASTAQTEERIRAAANAAFAAQRFDQVSLDDIARQAHVRIPTILRHFGSKERLFVLSTRALMQASQQKRGQATAKSLREVVAVVVDHFERQGQLILHFLHQEEQVPAIRAIIDEGRRYHHQWVMSMMTPLLPTLSSAAREQLEVQIYALTDVRFWQTLRHSLQQTRNKMEEAMFALLKGAISIAKREDASPP